MSRPACTNALRIALLGLAASPLLADPPALPPAQPPAADTPAAVAPEPVALDPLIADLSSPDFHARELATVRLRDDPAISLEQIEQALARTDLSLEARTRLTTIAHDRFLSSPRGAMGVSFDLTLQHRIAIGDTIPPFDCSRVLEPGDIILEADGIKVTGPRARATIQGLIVAHDPGDAMNLLVRRGKEKLDLSVVIGDFRNLRDSVLNPYRLHRAWTMRSSAYTPRPPAIRPPVNNAAWPDDIAVSRDRQMQLMRNSANSPMMLVHAGGRPRTPNTNNDNYSWYAVQSRSTGGRLPVWGADAFALQNAIDSDEPVPQPQLNPGDEIDRLTKRRDDVARELRSRMELGRRADPVPGEPPMRDRVKDLQTALRALERQIEGIKAEAEEAGTPLPSPQPKAPATDRK